MPLTEFQKRVLAVIFANRSESSHFAGGLVLNAAEDTARYSNDFDVFHDEVRDLDIHSRKDVEALEKAGFMVRKDSLYGDWLQPASFRRALVGDGKDTVAVDWAHDSAFRFFPIVPDPLLGWRLHLFDMAVNKALVLSSRTETRDYVDILELSKIYPLAAILWAACGKDEGFTPLMLLSMMRRFARIDPLEVHQIKARQLDPVEMKKAWIGISDKAESEISRIAIEMPDLPIGVVFVDEAGEPGWIGARPDLKIHHGSLRGCWPTLREVDSDR